MKINWQNQKESVNFFENLDVNTGFKVVSPHARGAVYIKVAKGDSDTKIYSSRHGHMECMMYEVATGKLFPPTSSPVEIVEIETNIHQKKPGIY